MRLVSLKDYFQGEGEKEVDTLEISYIHYTSCMVDCGSNSKFS